jgi:hypothetical protein
MNNIRIERKSPDGLTMQVWVFNISLTDGITAFLTVYILSVFVPEVGNWAKKVYSKNDSGDGLMQLSAVPIPSDLLDEVRERIINQIKVSVV